MKRFRKSCSNHRIHFVTTKSEKKSDFLSIPETTVVHPTQLPRPFQRRARVDTFQHPEFRTLQFRSIPDPSILGILTSRTRVDRVLRRDIFANTTLSVLLSTRCTQRIPFESVSGLSPGDHVQIAALAAPLSSNPVLFTQSERIEHLSRCPSDARRYDRHLTTRALPMPAG